MHFDQVTANGVNSNKYSKLTERGERFVKKRTTALLLGSVLLCHASLVYGEVPDYDTVLETAQKENKSVQTFETDDGKGNTVQVTADKKTLYVTARIAGIYSMPSDSSAELMASALGDQVEQTAICDNGWSKVEAESEGEKVIGYMQTQALNSENQILSVALAVSLSLFPLFHLRKNFFVICYKFPLPEAPVLLSFLVFSLPVPVFLPDSQIPALFFLFSCSTPVL